MDKRGIAAQKVDTERLGGAVERTTYERRLFGERRAYQTYGSYRNPFVYNRNTVFARQFARYFNYVFGFFAYAVVYSLRGCFPRSPYAGQQRYAHSYRSYVEMLSFDHLNRFKHVFIIEHTPPQTPCITLKISSC